MQGDTVFFDGLKFHLGSSRSIARGRLWLRYRCRNFVRGWTAGCGGLRNGVSIADDFSLGFGAIVGPVQQLSNFPPVGCFDLARSPANVLFRKPMMISLLEVLEVLQYLGTARYPMILVLKA